MTYDLNNVGHRVSLKAHVLFKKYGKSLSDGKTCEEIREMMLESMEQMERRLDHLLIEAKREESQHE